jgi:(p)ppGpp synthase/HD superfamily hydrolase
VSAEPSGSESDPSRRVRPKRLARAVAWSAELHDGQVRAGSGTPYVAHPLGVAALVLDHGGTEAEAIAALLHDVVEDTGATIDEVRERFGTTVARIVEGCTEVAVRKRKRGSADRSAATWWKRKRSAVRHLADPSTSESVLRVKAADQLWNVRSITSELRRRGPEVWADFHAGAVDQLWYHRSAANVVARRLPGRLADELRVAVGELERVAGWWFDVGDPQER